MGPQPPRPRPIEAPASGNVWKVTLPPFGVTDSRFETRHAFWCHGFMFHSPGLPSLGQRELPAPAHLDVELTLHLGPLARTLTHSTYTGRALASSSQPATPFSCPGTGTLHTAGISPSLHGLRFGETDLRSNSTQPFTKCRCEASSLCAHTFQGGVSHHPWDCCRGERKRRPQRARPCLAWPQPSLPTLPGLRFHHGCSSGPHFARLWTQTSGLRAPAGMTPGAGLVGNG